MDRTARSERVPWPFLDRAAGRSASSRRRIPTQKVFRRTAARLRLCHELQDEDTGSGCVEPGEAARGGRPSRYTIELGLAVCGRLMESASLRAACRDPAIPAASTVSRWLRAHPEFREHYAHAREVQAEPLLDELLPIADDGSRNWVTGPDGRRRVDADAIRRARLWIDARRWLLARMLPRVYGR